MRRQREERAQQLVRVGHDIGRQREQRQAELAHQRPDDLLLRRCGRGRRDVERPSPAAEVPLDEEPRLDGGRAPLGAPGPLARPRPPAAVRVDDREQLVPGSSSSSYKRSSAARSPLPLTVYEPVPVPVVDEPEPAAPDTPPDTDAPTGDPTIVASVPRETPAPKKTTRKATPKPEPVVEVAEIVAPPSAPEPPPVEEVEADTGFGAYVCAGATMLGLFGFLYGAGEASKSARTQREALAARRAAEDAAAIEAQRIQREAAEQARRERERGAAREYEAKAATWRRLEAEDRPRRSFLWLLKYVATADRRLSPNEEGALLNAVREYMAPERVAPTWAWLQSVEVGILELEEHTALLAALPDEQLRDLCAELERMAMADGKATPAERDRIGQIRRDFGMGA